MFLKQIQSKKWKNACFSTEDVRLCNMLSIRKSFNSPIMKHLFLTFCREFDIETNHTLLTSLCSSPKENY